MSASWIWPLTSFDLPLGDLRWLAHGVTRYLDWNWFGCACPMGSEWGFMRMWSKLSLFCRCHGTCLCINSHNIDSGGESHGGCNEDSIAHALSVRWVFGTSSNGLSKRGWCCSSCTESRFPGWKPNIWPLLVVPCNDLAEGILFCELRLPQGWKSNILNLRSCKDNAWTLFPSLQRCFCRIYLLSGCSLWWLLEYCCRECFIIATRYLFLVYLFNFFLGFVHPSCLCHPVGA
jgi:hypothetical protein